MLKHMRWGLLVMISVSGLYTILPDRGKGIPFLARFLAATQEMEENAGDRENPHSQTSDEAAFQSSSTDYMGLSNTEVQTRAFRKLNIVKEKAATAYFGERLIFFKPYLYDLKPETRKTDEKFFGHDVSLIDLPGPITVKSIDEQCALVIVKVDGGIKAMVIGFTFPNFDDSEVYLTEVCDVDPSTILYALGKRDTQSLVNKFKFPQEQQVYAYALMAAWKDEDGFAYPEQESQIVDLTDIEKARTSFTKIRTPK